MSDNLHNDIFDNLHFKKTEMKAKGISALYAKMLQQIMSQFKVVEANPKKFFSFDDYNQYKNSMAKLLEAFSKNITTEINKQSKESWKYAEKKNQKLLEQTMKKFGMKQLDLRKYKKSNLEALAAFQNRKESGLNLSDRVWNYTNQFKKEIEMGIDLGLREGKSAVQIARDVKQYLKYPDKLFRKVKDVHGNLGLSKAAEAFHPGQGVYRSSMKNAMRLARTENNMAYHAANYEKYNDFDFVIGIEVRLSNNPLHCPFCAAMAGKYPKDFKFVGWHPHCRCTTIPILKPDEEMEADNDLIALGQKPVPSKFEVLDLPETYKDYVFNNKDKLEGMSQKPYWYRDNNGFKAKEKPTIVPEPKIKKVKSAAEIASIQAQWDARKAEIQKIKDDANLTVQEAEKWGVSPDMIQGFTNVQDKLTLKQIQENVDILKKKIEFQKVMFEQYKSEIPNLEEHFKKFSLTDIQKAKESVMDKIEMWKGDSYYSKDWYIKKLKFEIGWLEDKQKYPTWKISQDIYKKELVEFQIKELYDSSNKLIEDLQKEIKKNPTKKAQGFIDGILKGHKEKDVDLLEKTMGEASSYLLQRQSKKTLGKSITINEARIRKVSLSEDAFQVHKDFIDITAERWALMDENTRMMVHAYTESSGKINRPLRGFDDSWFNEKGIGKVPFDNEKYSLAPYLKTLDLNKGIPDMARELEKHVFKKDTWLRRGEDMATFKGRFGIDLNDFKDKLEDLKGGKGLEEAFLSTSPVKGKGFNDTVELRIFAPEGTQGIYAEPFSYYGHYGNSYMQKEKGLKWNGSKNMEDASHEFEVILNQGYEMEIISVKYDPSKYSGRWEVEVALIKRNSKHKF